MLDRIPMDVINVSHKIRVVSDHVFPKPMLPERTLMALGSPRSHPLWSMKTRLTALRDRSLDDPPPRREIVVVWWQGPDRMQMIR